MKLSSLIFRSSSSSAVLLYVYYCRFSNFRLLLRIVDYIDQGKLITIGRSVCLDLSGFERIHTKFNFGEDTQLCFLKIPLPPTNIRALRLLKYPMFCYSVLTLFPVCFWTFMTPCRIRCIVLFECSHFSLRTFLVTNGRSWAIFLSDVGHRISLTPFPSQKAFEQQLTVLVLRIDRRIKRKEAL